MFYTPNTLGHLVRDSEIANEGQLLVRAETSTSADALAKVPNVSLITLLCQPKTPPNTSINSRATSYCTRHTWKWCHRHRNGDMRKISPTALMDSGSKYFISTWILPSTHSFSMLSICLQRKPSI